VENQAIFQNIKIIKDLMSSLPPVLVDSSQIQQVFINITLNAAEAMDGQGELTIVTRESQDGHHIEIGITDTGCGISEENMKRLFEPFYTTKEVGRGTGLGLAISYGIIQRNNGTIQVKSHVGEGTTFTIRLPIGKRDTEHHESASASGEIGMKTEQ
jgi:two-component system NtrC family sensor kinase